MSENGEGVLGDDSISMGVVTLAKRQSSQVEHLDLGGNSIVTIENAAHHYAGASSSVSQENFNLENVLVTSSRINHHINSTNDTPLHHAVAPGSHNYNALEYVSSPVVALQDDHQNKFASGLVPVSNVDFVDLNDGNMKGNAGPQLEIPVYFDVMPTTSSNTTHVPPTTTSYLPRHEHQTPKAQLLVRAYSDYIQPQEQQHQQAAQQQQINVHVHPNDQVESPNTDHSDSILPVLEQNFTQLEQAVITQNLNDYRKSVKMEPPKRQMQIQVQQKQIQSFISDGLVEHHSAHNQKLILSEQMQSHEESLHNQQLNQSRNLKEQQSFQAPSQPRYQLIQKQFTQPQRQINLTDYVLKDELSHQNLIIQYPDNQEKTIENNTPLIKTSIQNEVSSPKINEPVSKIEHSHNMPLVSRSGRPIRRRPEYIEYVNQNIKEEQMQHSNRNVPIVKIEANGINSFEDEEEDLDDDENDISNDDDHEQSGVYSSDGKKSLPHKKRIPKKLKNAKKHVKCYKCNQCGEQFINQSNFTQHKQIHMSTNKARSFSCEICAKVCDSQLKFFEHLKSHYEPFKKHKCEVCGGEFASGELLQEHSLVHSREHYECNICHKTFRRESMLEVHLKVAHLEEEEDFNNTIERPYTCTVCPKSYRSQLTLDAHVQSEHSDNPPEYTCEDCCREFKSKLKLISHRKVEHKEENSQGRGAPKKKLKIGKTLKGCYVCTHCPRTFTHKNSLIYHIRGHTGERPHQCEQCGKAFYAASALKVHLRLHSGEKPYKCNDCGKFFRQWGDLSYHTSSVHSEARRFQCEFCGKDFKRKYCLVVHRRIHTGEKKYKCEHCSKSFRASSYLQNHKRIHTGERPYPCPDCSKPFRVRSDMKRHRNTHFREAWNASTSSPLGTTTTTTTTSPPTTVGQLTAAATSSSNQSLTQVSSQTHTVIARQSNHPHQSQVQILQRPVTSSQLGQLIISDSVPGIVNDQNQPIRIMVSGLGQQPIGHAIQPPPAHRHSQVTAVSVSNSMAPTSPSGAVHLSTSANGVAPEVIIMDESNNQPINLNILPRMITQPSANAGEEEEPGSSIRIVDLSDSIGALSSRFLFTVQSRFM